MENVLVYIKLLNLNQDDEQSKVVLPQEMSIRGAITAQQSSVRLVELGPRIRYLIIHLFQNMERFSE